MYISWKNYEKFLEAQVCLENQSIISISEVVEASEKIHIEPLKGKVVSYIVRHPDKMQKRFGFTNIKSI